MGQESFSFSSPFENVLLKMIQQVSWRLVPCHNKRQTTISSLGSTHSQFFTLLPNHLRKMPRVALETWLIKSVILNLGIPHVCCLITRWFKLPREHGDVFTSPFTLWLRSVLKATGTCQLFCPGLRVLCNLIGPFQWWCMMLGPVFVVCIEGLLWKASFWARAWRARSSLQKKNNNTFGALVKMTVKVRYGSHSANEDLNTKWI